jgi:hypothetical protein
MMVRISPLEAGRSCASIVSAKSEANIGHFRGRQERKLDLITRVLSVEVDPVSAKCGAPFHVDLRISGAEFVRSVRLDKVGPVESDFDSIRPDAKRLTRKARHLIVVICAETSSASGGFLISRVFVDGEAGRWAML